MASGKGKANGKAENGKAGNGKAALKCPECGGPVDPTSEHRPFCSARCRQLDLGRWLRGGYAIPGPPADPSDMDES